MRTHTILIMGAYLSKPNTDKESESGTSSLGHRFGLSSMQGWRRHQEDAHIATDVQGTTAVYGVFDGHGGREVSNFTVRHFANVLQGVPSFSDNLESAMVPAFHQIDVLLNDTQHLEELKALKAKPRDGDADGDADGSDGSDEAEGGESGGGESGGGGQRIKVEDAVDLFQKMLLFKKMQQQAAAGGPPPAAGAGGGPSDGDAAPGGELMRRDAPRICTLPPSHVDAGCTAVVACVRGSQLVVANAGDSRAVLCRNGAALPLSEDHKPALERESSRIEQAGGWVTAQGRINGNLNLSRALGDLKYKGNAELPPSAQIITAEPDVRAHTLTEQDEFLVLACDGIWDCMSNQEVVDFVRERLPSTPLHTIVEEMFERCVSEDPKLTQGIGGDNMTAIIVAFR